MSMEAAGYLTLESTLEQQAAFALGIEGKGKGRPVFSSDNSIRPSLRP